MSDLEQKREIENAKITSLDIGTFGRGILTFGIGLEYYCGCQMAGLFACSHYDEKKKRQVGTLPLLEEVILRLCEVFEVDNVYNIVNMNCRVERTYSKVYSIGHIYKDKWCIFEDIINEVSKQK